MAEQEQDIDVAISFVSEDLGFASELRDRLGDSLNVFLYTRRQEELAGTNGLESLRDVFNRRARLVVILLGQRWGKTPWTRVEEEAITDRFLKRDGPAFLFVITMDESAPPPWLPEKLLRFNKTDFGVDEAAGAIKARALERGSVVQRQSIASHAARAREVADFEDRKAQLQRSREGVSQVKQEAKLFIERLTKLASEVEKAEPTLGVEYGANELQFVMKRQGVAIDVSYHNRIINVLDEARLLIREIRGPVLLPGQHGYFFEQPRELARAEFQPELTRADGWCWKSHKGEVVTSQKLADDCILRFLGLVQRDAKGKLPAIEW